MIHTSKSMKQLVVSITLIIVVSVLSACTSIISPLDCSSLDWRVQGYKDGKAGKSSENFESFKKACAQHKINPNQQRYLAGYRDGQSVYCDPQNAYQIGLKGSKHSGSCPETMRQAFVAAFEYGSKLHDSQRQLRRNRITIKKNERNLLSLKNSLAKVEERILEITKDSKDINRLSADLAKLKEKLYTYSQTAGTLQTDTQKTMTELENLKNAQPPVPSHS